MDFKNKKDYQILFNINKGSFRLFLYSLVLAMEYIITISLKYVVFHFLYDKGE